MSKIEKCSVNNCPLESIYPQRCQDNEDREKQCTMEKNVRTRIGVNHPELKYGGLKQREYSAKIHWDNMAPEQKTQIEMRLKLTQFVPAVKVSVGV